jgi:hypothetical protein
MRWRLLGCFILIAAMPILTACDPLPVPSDRRSAEIHVRAVDNGRADMDLLFPWGTERSDMVSVGRHVAATAFPHSISRLRIEANGGGFHYVVVTAARTYRPGRNPTFVFDAAAPQAVLRHAGFTRVSLDVCGPLVPLSITTTGRADSLEGRCAFWREIPTPAPRVTIAMHPSAGRWWEGIGLILLAAIADAAALQAVHARKPLTAARRVYATMLAGAALVACASGFASAKAIQADNLGAQGLLSGFPLEVARALPLLLLPLGAAALVLSALALTTRRPRPIPVGWEPPAASPSR